MVQGQVHVLVERVLRQVVHGTQTCTTWSMDNIILRTATHGPRPGSTSFTILYHMFDGLVQYDLGPVNSQIIARYLMAHSSVPYGPVQYEPEFRNSLSPVSTWYRALYQMVNGLGPARTCIRLVAYGAQPCATGSMSRNNIVQERVIHVHKQLAHGTEPSTT